MSVCLSISVLFISGLYSNFSIDPGLLPRFLAGSILVFGFVFIFTIRAIRSRTGYDSGTLCRAIFPALICYLAISGLSLINAINLAEGLFEWLKLFMLAAFFYAAVLIFSEHRHGITVAVRGIILTAIILSAIGICQYYRLAFTSIPGNYIIYSTLAHKNLYASAVFLMLPFALFGVYRFSHLWQAASWISVSLTTAGIILARTRTVWVAIIAATVVVGAVLIVRHRESLLLNWKKWLRFNHLGWVCGLLALFFLIVLPAHINDRIANTSPQFSPFAEPVWSTSTLNERLSLLEKSLEMAGTHPLLGVGLGQWWLAFPAYGKIQKLRQSDAGQAEVIFRRPHNDYIWILSESGVLGLLSYLAILGISIFYALKLIFKSGDADNKALATCMLFGIIGYMIISFFSFPKERIVHNIFLMLFLTGLVSAYHRSFPKHNAAGRSMILFVNMLTLVLLAFCAIVGYIRLDSEIHVREALASHRAGNWHKLLSEIDKADSRFYPVDPTSIPLAWYRGIANYSIGKFQEAHKDFNNAYQIHPNHIHVLNNLGTSYAKLGDYESAAAFYKKALDVWPGFTEARINLGVLYVHTGNKSEAMRHLGSLDHTDIEWRLND